MLVQEIITALKKDLMDDVKDALKQLKQKQNEAGIKKGMDELQKQYDAWKAKAKK